MELIKQIVLAALGTFAGLISSQLSDEFKAWCPWFVARIIRRAVRQLPETHRERFAEEWQAHVNEVPGQFGKFIVAIGFLLASKRISLDSSEHRLSALSKRIFDIVFSLVAILVCSPLSLLIGVAIKLDSPGPILVRQVRYGFDNKPIACYKFRVTNVSNEGTMTRVGRRLYAINLDELPSFINVLVGDMSIVGPRAITRDTSEMFQDKLGGSAFRGDAKPGITGWAQVNARSRRFEDRIHYDLFYLENRSFLLDLRIILRTLMGKAPPK